MEAYDVSDFHNYLRLSTLLKDCGSMVLRGIFRDRYKWLKNIEWEDGSQNGIDFHKNEGKKLNLSSPVQKSKLEEADINQWDLNLLSLVLRNIDYSNGSPQIKSKHDVENKAIEDLIDVRNRYAHMPTVLVSSTDFNNLWQSAESALIKLGLSAKDIDNVKNCKDLDGIEFKNAISLSEENLSKAKRLREDGQLAFKSKDFENAINAHTKALKLNGLSRLERGSHFYYRSCAYMRRLDSETSEAEITKILNFAFQDAKSVIEYRPMLWKGYYMIGQIFQYKKEWKSAIFSFNHALALSLNDEKEVVDAIHACWQEVQQNQTIVPFDPANIQNRGNANGRKLFPGEYAAEASSIDIEKWRNSKDSKLKALAFLAIAHQHMKSRTYEMAFRSFSKSEKIGSAEAAYHMGLLHKMGWGIPKNLQLTIQFFTRATEYPFDDYNAAGIIAAQIALGKCYEGGDTVLPRNYKKAAKLYLQASERGSGEAASKLANLYKVGHGVEKNHDLAMQYWKLAAERGYAVAMESLAWEFLAMNDSDEAQSWYLQSIEAGNLHSILNQTFFDERLQELEQHPVVDGIISGLPGSTLCEQNAPEDVCPETLNNIPSDLAILSNLMNSFQIDNDSTDSDEDSISLHRPKASVVKATPEVDTSSAPIDGRSNTCDNKSTPLSKQDSKITAAVDENKNLNQDSVRVGIVVKHRGKKAATLRDELKNARKSRAVQNSSVRVAPFTRLIGLNKIVLRKMDSDTDKVYSGYVIKVTIMEDCIFDCYPVVQTIVKDDDDEFQFCYFSCDNEKETEMRMQLTFGSEISILEPYVVFTSDGGRGIHATVPSDIFLHSKGKDNSFCRFCSKAEPSRHCGRCKRAWYCNDECQKQDWMLLKHKLVCKA